VPPSGTVPGRALSIFFPLGITLTVYSSGLGALGDKARGRRGKVQGDAGGDHNPVPGCLACHTGPMHAGHPLTPSQSVSYVM
jgi:hypothetical protein